MRKLATDPIPMYDREIGEVAPAGNVVISRQRSREDVPWQNPRSGRVCRWFVQPFGPGILMG